MTRAKNRRLSALRDVDPAAWQAEVRAALLRTGGVAEAAEWLGVGRATLFLWLQQVPAIREGIDLPLRGGWPAKPGGTGYR